MSDHSPLDLLLYLNSLGDVVLLDLAFEPFQALQELEAFSDKWVIYNPDKPGLNRWGLSLTSLDGGLSGVPDLTSLKEYNSRHGTAYGEDQFTTPTPVLKQCPTLRKPLEKVSPLGRSHILRLGKGGFFPPHRDNALLRPECFRLFASFNYTATYSLVINDRQYLLEAGSFYLLNTTLAHSLVSFSDFSDFVVLNLPLKEESVEKVNSLLAQN